eukprot:4169063-Pyramimonas_sp.AAC.1
MGRAGTAARSGGAIGGTVFRNRKEQQEYENQVAQEYLRQVPLGPPAAQPTLPASPAPTSTSPQPLYGMPPTSPPQNAPFNSVNAAQMTSPNVVNLAVPLTWQPGQLLQFNSPNGITMQVEVPLGVPPGGQFIVAVVRFNHQFSRISGSCVVQVVRTAVSYSQYRTGFWVVYESVTQRHLLLINTLHYLCVALGARPRRLHSASSGSSAMASMQPSLVQLSVTVPAGVQSGQIIQFQAPNGQMVQVPVPAGVPPGGQFG